MLKMADVSYLNESIQKIGNENSRLVSRMGPILKRSLTGNNDIQISAKKSFDARQKLIQPDARQKLDLSKNKSINDKGINDARQIINNSQNSAIIKPIFTDARSKLQQKVVTSKTNISIGKSKPIIFNRQIPKSIGNNPNPPKFEGYFQINSSFGNNETYPYNNHNNQVNINRPIFDNQMIYQKQLQQVQEQLQPFSRLVNQQNQQHQNVSKNSAVINMGGSILKTINVQQAYPQSFHNNGTEQIHNQMSHTNDQLTAPNFSIHEINPNNSSIERTIAPNQMFRSITQPLAHNKPINNQNSNNNNNINNFNTNFQVESNPINNSANYPQQTFKANKNSLQSSASKMAQQQMMERRQIATQNKFQGSQMNNPNESNLNIISQENLQKLNIKKVIQQTNIPNKPKEPEEPVVEHVSPLQSFRVIVSNLGLNVTFEDVEELFQTCGALRKLKMTKVGVAEVFFVNHESAVAAVEEYNGVDLDDQPMSVVLSFSQPEQHDSHPLRSKKKQKAVIQALEVDQSVIQQAIFRAHSEPAISSVDFTVRV